MHTHQELKKMSEQSAIVIKLKINMETQIRKLSHRRGNDH